VLAAEFPGRNAGFSLTDNNDDLFVGKCFFIGIPLVADEDIHDIKMY